MRTDGSHFLFYSASERAVSVASLDVSTPKRVVASDSNAAFAPPDQMFFVRDGLLLAQRFDVGRMEATGDARPLAEQVAWLDRVGRVLETVGPPGDYVAPALSPDEKRLAFTRRDDQAAGDIWTLDLTPEAPPQR